MGRRKDSYPLPAAEICRLYRAGEPIKSLAIRYRASDRGIRKTLVDNDVPIRPKGRTVHYQGRPADGRLTPEKVQELRDRIGYHPSWVELPEYEYDRSHGYAR